MTYDSTDPDDDGVVEADIDNDSVDTENATVTNATSIRASRGSDTSSTSSGTFINAYDTESKDVRDEFNSSQQFVPDETGEYYVIGTVQFGSDSVQGDAIRLEVRETGGGTDPLGNRMDMQSPVSFPTVNFAFKLNLTAGSQYEIQATNLDSSFVIRGTNKTEATITRGLVE